MAEPLFGMTRADRNAVNEVVLHHRQRLPDAGRRTRRVWPGGGGTGTITIGFQIDSIVNDVVTATITFRPCGMSEVPEEYGGTVELLDDLFECLLNEDDAALINRRGYAAYMEDAVYHLCGWQVVGLCCP